MDSIEKLKLQYLSELNTQYKNLINSISVMDINKQFKSNAFQNLDQGVMWIQKGIEILQLQQQENPQQEINLVKEEVKPEENVTIN